VKSTWGAWYWWIWISVATVTLLGPETYALITNPRNTLSDWVWDKLSVPVGEQLPWTAAHYLVFGAWLVLMSWLTFHFFFRRFT
jgi:hypothetical protein